MGSGQFGSPSRGRDTTGVTPGVTPAQRSCRVATDVDVRPLLGAARRSARSMRSTARRPMPWRLASSLERARPCVLTPRVPRAPVATPSSCCHRRPQHRKLAALGKGSRLRQTHRRCCIGHRHGDLIPSLCTVVPSLQPRRCLSTGVIGASRCCSAPQVASRIGGTELDGLAGFGSTIKIGLKDLADSPPLPPSLLSCPRRPRRRSHLLMIRAPSCGHASSRRPEPRMCTCVCASCAPQSVSVLCVSCVHGLYASYT